MNKKIILLMSMFVMMIILGTNTFAAKVGDVRGIDGIESVTTEITGENTCSVTIKLGNTPLITLKEPLSYGIGLGRSYWLCPHYMFAHSNYTVSNLFPKLKSFVNDTKYLQGNRSEYKEDGWVYLYKFCTQRSSNVRFSLSGNICKSEKIDVFVFMPFVHVDGSSYNDIWYADSANPSQTAGAHTVELGNRAVNYFVSNTTQSNYKKLNAAGKFDIELNKPAESPTPPETTQNTGAGSTGAGGTGAGSTGVGDNGGDTGAGYTKSHLQACKNLGYVEHPSYPVGLADGVPVGGGRTKTSEPGDYLYKCEDSSVFGNTIRVTRCNPYTGEFGFGAGEPRGEVAISELHEQLCKEIEQIRRAEEEQREAELYDTININYEIKPLIKIMELKDQAIELNSNPEKTIFFLNYNQPAVPQNNLDLNFALPTDFNSDKNTCYLITSLGQNTQVDINTFFDKFTQENNYITDSNALSNVNCNQITENNVILRSSRTEEKYFLALQKIDDTNILVTSAQVKFMNRELYLSYLRYEINKKIARFFCPSCNLPNIETPTESTQTFTYPQKTLRVLKEEAPVVAETQETAQTGNLITSFIINGVNGVINNTESAIKVTLPIGTAVTNLTPTITVSEGATVNPASGVAQDFTNPVNYTVTPQTGDQKVYTVVVNHSTAQPEGNGGDSGNLCGINKQQNLTEYINCLKNNIEIVNLNRSYAAVINGQQVGSPIPANTLIDQKYNLQNSSDCYNREGFNEQIFKMARQMNLSEEETAQLWGRIAAESGCQLSCGDGEACGSQGISQINAPEWKTSTGYNALKTYLLPINNTKYNTQQKYFNVLNNIRTDHDGAVEISYAIDKYHNSLIFNESRNSSRPLIEVMGTTYDHDDAIDLFFASSYVYGGGYSYHNHFPNGIVNTDSRYQGVVYTALHKVGYYLAYKRMIYECSKTPITNNKFVTAYKTIYQGQHCQ